MRKSTSWVLLGLLVFILFSINAFLILAGELFWFQSLDRSRVFWTQFWSRSIPPVICILVYLVFALWNLSVARKWWRSDSANQWLALHEAPPLLEPWQIRGMLSFAMGMSCLLMLLVGYTQWLPILRWIHRVPFEMVDPVFRKDISFFIFSLPMLLFLRMWLLIVLCSTFALIAGTYLVKGAIQAKQDEPLHVASHARKHLSLLGVGICLLFAWGFWLNQYRLMYTSRGTFFGASYTDVHVRVFSLRVLTLAGLLASAMLGASVRFPKKPLAKWAAIGLAILLFVFNWMIPTLVQGVLVKPNELTKEGPYIKHNIEFTRSAYGLGEIEEHEFHFMSKIPEEKVDEARRNLQKNGKVWDHRVIRETYRQQQELRPYYIFSGIDEDRYWVEGRLRHMMVAARELSVARLPASAQNWVQRHLQYTHGYGLCISPVNEFSTDGGPIFSVSDIPVRSNIGLKVERPEIYFGENTFNYVIVKLDGINEFGYPLGNENVETRYEADSGVEINSTFRRLALFRTLGSTQILFTRYITKESRALYHREIRNRVSRLAPFFEYDNDPYLVLAEGKLYWIMDAYTVSKGYPYSRPFPGLLIPEDQQPAPPDQETLMKRSIEGMGPQIQQQEPFLKGINYIRNPVKVVVDAYTGEVAFYVLEDEEPLLKVYKSAFPDLFLPFSEMPASLRAHIRYPKDLFKVQSYVYCEYHMTDPTQFFQREDMWRPPLQKYQDQNQVVEPYYVTLRFQDESEDEFVQFMPFVPSGKDNMVAYLCARCDGHRYGELRAYRLPKGELINGPMQIESRIDQHPGISEKLSLWDQKGSRVIRGNLIVMPIFTSFMYLEPIYLLSSSTEIPEIKAVVVADHDSMFMENSIQSASDKLFGLETRVAAMDLRREPEDTDVRISAIDEVQEARRALEEAKESLRSLDWSAFGEGIRRVERLLETLEQRISLESSGEE